MDKRNPSFFVLEPEVAGGLGEGTVISDMSVQPPIVISLHYEFQGWLGDDLLESFPCFIVTSRLADKLRRSEMTGYRLAAVKVSTSDLFREMHPRRKLPPFQWLQPVGEAGVDDFGLSSKPHRLVVSKRALECLRGFQLEHCDVSEWRG
jgi:hypothetical protein